MVVPHSAGFDVVVTTRCRICSHDQREEIEAGGALGADVAKLATKYEISVASLERHLAQHVSAPQRRPGARTAALLAARARRARPATPAVANADEVPPPATSRCPISGEEPTEDAPATAPTTARAALDGILLEIHSLTRGARAAKAPFAEKAAAIRAALHATKLLASLTGELGATEATVVSSPYFRRMLEVILEAVREPKFSEARQAIIDALAREERGGRAEDQAA